MWNLIAAKKQRLSGKSPTGISKCNCPNDTHTQHIWHGVWWYMWIMGAELCIYSCCSVNCWDDFIIRERQLITTNASTLKQAWKFVLGVTGWELMERNRWLIIDQTTCSVSWTGWMWGPVYTLWHYILSPLSNWERVCCRASFKLTWTSFLFSRDVEWKGSHELPLFGEL